MQVPHHVTRTLDKEILGTILFVNVLELLTIRWANAAISWDNSATCTDIDSRVLGRLEEISGSECRLINITS